MLHVLILLVDLFTIIRLYVSPIARVRMFMHCLLRLFLLELGYFF